MKICYFGIYDPEYARNQVLMMGLRENGVEVVECRVDPKKYSGFSKYWQLLHEGFQLKKRRMFDVVIVGFPGQSVYWIACLLWGKKAIIDMFLSLYDTNVLDRRLYTGWGMRGLRDWFYDWYSAHLVSCILLDTNEHITYITKAFGVSVKKFIRVPVSANPEIFRPLPMPPHTNFVVGFTGMFSPLHGAQYIIEAAKILREHADITFTLVGSGQDEKNIFKLIQKYKLESSVNCLPAVPQEQLPRIIAGFDICLGIFGASEKAARVIPNKFYQYAAMQKPIITANTPALQEYFVDNQHYLGCRAADGKDLAEKILKLYSDRGFSGTISKNVYEYYCKNLQPKSIVNELIASLSKHEI
ncbi:MAG: glycosyltransferase [Candidatus Paceibacterota bacterium]|jgi:glycosyltransferase involved in cell wall biosynthesis